jgi:hypothetical protein
MRGRYMRKMIRILLAFMAMVLVLSMPALAAGTGRKIAAPEGYRVVQLTEKNFSKFFEIKKYKLADPSGTYLGYEYRPHGKRRRNRWFVYTTRNLRVRLTGTELYAWKDHKEKIKAVKTKRMTLKGLESSFAMSDFYLYQFGKLVNVKVEKARGRVVFVKPSNVLGIEIVEENGMQYYRIKLLHPYDENTPAVTHVDEETQETVVDYYYMDRYRNPNNPGIYY